MDLSFLLVATGILIVTGLYLWRKMRRWSIQQAKTDLMNIYGLSELDMNSKCSEEHIIEIQNVISWDDVGRYLNEITRLDLKDIRNDGKDEADRRRLLVDLWEDRCGDDATYDAVITAMLKAGKVNEAKTLCRLFQDTAHEHQLPYHVHSPASLTWNWLRGRVATSVLYLLPKQIRKKKKLCLIVVSFIIILLQTLVYNIGIHTSMFSPTLPTDSSHNNSSNNLQSSPLSSKIHQQPSTSKPPAIYSVYAKFLKEYYMVPLSVPDTLPITYNNEYVQLALIKKVITNQAEADKFTLLTFRADADQIRNKKEEITMKDIFPDDESIRLVVVEGAPGIDKSTLAYELCHQWYKGTLLQQFSIVVLIRLREERVQSATSLIDLFYHPHKHTLEELEDEVNKNAGESVLFIFDGFDELPKGLRKSSLVTTIIKDSIFKVLVTTRHSASADLQPQLQYSRRIEIVGFTEEKYLKMANNTFKNYTIFSQFKALLISNPVIEAMMYVPLNCAMVINIYKETYVTGRSVPHTQTQLYTRMTLWLLSRYLNRIKDPRSGHLPDRLENLDQDLYEQLMSIGKLAYDGVMQDDVIFNELPKNCSALGLLVEHHSFYSHNEATRFNFFHLTLQEYMGAFYMSQQNNSQQRELFYRRYGPPSTHVLVRFLAGLIQLKNIEWNIEVYMPTSTMKQTKTPVWDLSVHLSTSRSDTKLSHVYDLYEIQLFFESQNTKCCTTFFFDQSSTVYFDSGQNISNYDVYAVGYMISLCQTSWNLRLESVNDVGLQALSNGIMSIFNGRGFIEALELVMSPFVLNKGLQLPQIYMKNILSLKLFYCNISSLGYDNLIKSIFLMRKLKFLKIKEFDESTDLYSQPPGSFVKLMWTLRQCRTLTTLCMGNVLSRAEEVSTLLEFIQSSNNLKQLRIGVNYKADIDVNKQLLLKTVMTASSLETVIIDIKQTQNFSVSEYIDSISDRITSLYFYNPGAEAYILDTHTRECNKGFCEFIRKNTSLKQLTLQIFLEWQEVMDILIALKDNQSLERVELPITWETHLSAVPAIVLDSRVVFKFFGPRFLPEEYLPPMHMENCVFVY